MTTPDENEDLAPGAHLDPRERDVEAPIADAYEQATPAGVEEAGGEPAEEIHRGLEVSEYDAVEQAHVVIMDDEY